MSNRSSCRVLRFLGMDGFLGFKCGPSCSEKQHNKEIKALIDAIDDLLAYDSKTKKELGAQDPGFGDARRKVQLSKLDVINRRSVSLMGTHAPEIDWTSSVPCDATLQRLSVTADSARERIVNRRVEDVQGGDADPQGGALLDKEMRFLTSNRYELASKHDSWGQLE